MKKIVIISIFVAGTALVRAQDTSFFQASLTPDIAIEPRTTQINGLSLNIWGENPQNGVALGFINGSTGQSSGFSWGLLNYAESYTGVQFGIVNCSSSSFTGWQDAILNYSAGSFVGLQSGVVNIAQNMSGLQLGTVNYASNLNGVQIGLVNVAANNGWFDEFPSKLAKGFPIVNWSF